MNISYILFHYFLNNFKVEDTSLLNLKIFLLVDLYDKNRGEDGVDLTWTFRFRQTFSYRPLLFDIEDLIEGAKSVSSDYTIKDKILVEAVKTVEGLSSKTPKYYSQTRWYELLAFITHFDEKGKSLKESHKLISILIDGGISKYNFDKAIKALNEVGFEIATDK